MILQVVTESFYSMLQSVVQRSKSSIAVIVPSIWKYSCIIHERCMSLSKHFVEVVLISWLCTVCCHPITPSNDIMASYRAQESNGVLLLHDIIDITPRL